MSDLPNTEFSKPPTGRKGRAKVFYQDDGFFEKSNANLHYSSTTSFKNSLDVSKEYEQSFHSASMISDGSSSPVILTHRSANFINIPPPVKPRTKIPSQTLNSLESDAANKNVFSVDNTSSEMFKHGKLNSVFTFESKSVDLVLEDTKIKWKYISDNKAKHHHEFAFDLTCFYGIEPKVNSFPRRSRSRAFLRKDSNKHKNLTDDSTILNGFTLHMFYRDKINVYRPRSLTFEHPHSDTCHEWMDRFVKLMPVLQETRHVLILLNPFAGEKKTRSIYNTHLVPLLATAQIKHTTVEFHENLNLKENLLKNKICIENFYGIVVMAGDSGCSTAINTIIELVSNEEDLASSEMNELSSKLKTPFCIIPCGATNMIATSIYGTADFISPLMFLFYGNTIRIDLSTLFTTKQSLHSFGFNYSCGFGSTLARYFLRYSQLGVKKVQTSMVRGAAKQNHKAIDVEISYLPNNDSESSPNDENICVKGCKVCNIRENKLHIKLTHDEVENFSSALNQKNGTGWKTLRDSFIHISFVTNAALGFSTSGGQSKYAHLGDGCIDMILVEPVHRKDFYRYIKRHTNFKNQLNLPFVKAIRIKEAHIKILNLNLNTLDSRKQSQSIDITSTRLRGMYGFDKDYNKVEEIENSDEDNLEMDNEIASNVHRSIHLNSKQSSGTQVTRIKSNHIKIQSSDDEAPMPTNHESNVYQSKGSSSFIKKSRSILDLLKGDYKYKNETKRASLLNEKEDNYTILNSFKNKSVNKKFLKSPTLWNCDWKLYSLPEMHIRCYRQFLPVFASGLDVDTDIENTNTFVSCLSPM